MTEKKSKNKSNVESDYLTLDGISKLLSISRMTLYNIINAKNSTFPKGFEIMKSEKNRPFKIYKRADIINWLEKKTPRS
mgnify:CR=1 FL=1